MTPNDDKPINGKDITIPLNPARLRPNNSNAILNIRTASVVSWSEFLATDPEVLGSIPGASRFSEKQWVWNGVHSAS
jgi:hypothetical protein